MSLEARITMEPKAWLRFLDKLAAADMMHEFNIIEAAYTDAKRSKQLATTKAHRERQKSLTGVVGVTL